MISESPVPFEAFMRHALYDPERGYYSRHITGVGHRGDFTTAPQLSEMPAIAIARWAEKNLRETGCRHLIEIGPGSGTLAAAIRKHLPWRTRIRTRIHLVETSPPLAAIQRKLLGNRAVWHPSPAAALAACNGRAVIYSNELVDAFPVRRFKNTPLGWEEVFVHRDAGGFIRESTRPVRPLPDSATFAIPHPVGALIEVHQSYQQWLQEWLPLWKAGAMLTIDYGDKADRLYYRKPRGTLRAYLLQQRLEGPEIYQNTGRQDLTADVNFSDLIHWSSPWLETRGLNDLASWLCVHAPRGNDPACLDASGAGSAFKVLDQIHRGHQQPPRHGSKSP